jgi:hypothetical protein
MLRRTVSRAIWHTYDALGRLLLANVAWFLLSVPWVAFLYWMSRRFAHPFAAVVMLGVVPVAFLNPAAAGLAEMAQRLAETGDTELRTFWRGIRTNFSRAMLLMSAGVLLTMLVGSSVVFYGRGVLGVLGPAGNAAAAGMSVWVGVVLSGMACFWMPVAVGTPGKRPRVGFIMKRSALLAGGSPVFALGLVALTAAVAAFWVGTVVGVVALGMSSLRVLHAEARQMLREREEAAGRVAAQGESPTRQRVRRELLAGWAAMPRRSVRELIRPWGDGA